MSRFGDLDGEEIEAGLASASGLRADDPTIHSGERSCARRDEPLYEPTVATVDVPETTGSAEGSVGSVRDILNARDARRFRLFMWANFIDCLIGTVVVAVVPTDPTVQEVAIGSMITIDLWHAWLLRRLYRFEDLSDEGLIPFPMIFAVCAATVAIHVAAGLLAPLSLGPVLGVMILVVVAIQPVAAFQAWLVLAIGYAIPIALMATHVIAPIGFFEPQLVDDRILVARFCDIELSLFAGWALGMLGRQYGLFMTEKVDAAMREMHRQEALLQEAQEELRRAVGAGGPGRFTGQEIGPFLLGEVIGRGGMGDVYAATDLRSQQEAAVKLLRPGLVTQTNVLRRFEREAEIIAGVESPHVVRVTAVSDPAAPIPFLGMERLRGRDLAELLRERGRLDPAAIVELVDAASRALEVAHEKGIVHRDLKPQNLFLSEREGEPPVWKVLDFGISKIISSDDIQLTLGRMVGTPAYMSPEQARSASTVDERSDLYSLPVVAYRCLTGEPAFEGADAAQTILAVLQRMPPHPAFYVEAEPDLVSAIRIGIAKAPEDRYQDCQSMREAFAAALVGELPEALRRRAQRLTQQRPWGDAPDVDETAAHGPKRLPA